MGQDFRDGEISEGILLEDGETVHNAFFDTSYKEK